MEEDSKRKHGGGEHFLKEGSNAKSVSYEQPPPLIPVSSDVEDHVESEHVSRNNADIQSSSERTPSTSPPLPETLTFMKKGNGDNKARGAKASGGGGVVAEDERGRARNKKRAHISSTAPSTPQRFDRNRPRPRSHSRSRVLTERILFFEQVWQGHGDDDDGVDGGHVPITRSRSALDDTEFTREIDALEERLSRQRQRFKSGSVFFERVTLRETHSPTSSSQSRHLAPEGGLVFQEKFSRSESHLNQRLGSPENVPHDLGSTRFSPREGSLDRGDVKREEPDYGDDETMAHSSKRTSKSPVYDELMSYSFHEWGGNTPDATESYSSISEVHTRRSCTPSKSRNDTSIHPECVSTSHEAAGTPSSARSSTPSENVSEYYSSSTCSRMSTNARLAKLEFLGVAPGAISRSRTPSGGTSLSSLRSGSPRIGERSTSLGGGEFHHHSYLHEQREAGHHGHKRFTTVTTISSEAPEVRTFRIVQSPSSGVGSVSSPVSDTSSRQLPQEVTTPVDVDNNPSQMRSYSVSHTPAKITTSRSYNQISEHHRPSPQPSSTVQSPSSFDDSTSEDYYLMSSTGIKNVTGDSVRNIRASEVDNESFLQSHSISPEWYTTHYKSKVAAASQPIIPAETSVVGAGRFETDVTKSAKSRAAYFDSHIAEIKGT